MQHQGVREEVLRRFQGLGVMGVVFHEGVEDVDNEAIAAALGIPLERVGKTLIVRAGQFFVAVVLRSTDRLDVRLLSRAVGVSRKRVRLATRSELELLGCKPGLIPPTITREKGLPGYVDVRALRAGWLVFSSGYPGVGVKVDTGSLLRIGYKVL
ncbi:MAG: hypothetical protein B6U73_04990 [Desulfurococcales archaeon ex4484_204]|nr:MAG: hypothetical protein B6U73_04990 [Desulfurococcales archaeon ex4484_204]